MANKEISCTYLRGHVINVLSFLISCILVLPPLCQILLYIYDQFRVKGQPPSGVTQGYLYLSDLSRAHFPQTGQGVNMVAEYMTLQNTCDLRSQRGKPII